MYPNGRCKDAALSQKKLPYWIYTIEDRQYKVCVSVIHLLHEQGMNKKIIWLGIEGGTFRITVWCVIIELYYKGGLGGMPL